MILAGISLSHVLLSHTYAPHLTQADHVVFPQPVIKPQYVDHIPKAVRGNVLETLKARDQKGHLEQLMVDLELVQVRIKVNEDKCEEKCVESPSD